MPIQYEVLTESKQVELARQRVAEIESEHFRLRLRLAEVDSQQEDQELRARILDLERRHQIHVTVEQPAPAAPPAPPAPPAEQRADGAPAVVDAPPEPVDLVKAATNGAHA